MAHMASDYEKLDREMDYEEKGLPAKSIGLFILGLLVGLLSIMAAMYAFIGVPQSIPRPDVVMNRKMLAPTLQADPARTMRAFKVKQSDHLASYGWVDKAQGTVRIPIEVAMDLALQRGFYPQGTESKRDAKK